MRIVVLAGGLSPERDVSFSSGSLVANALLDKGHSVVMADVYEGVDLPERAEDAFLSPSGSFRYHYDIPSVAPDLHALIAKHNGRQALIGKNILELCSAADVVFIALHGSMGENGQLQAVLESFDICYTGSDYCGSLLAMDKDLSKKLIRLAGVPTADWILVRPTEGCIRQVREHIGFPCVIKPIHCGSSVGISIVKDEEDLLPAVQVANEYEPLILAEKMISGREFSVGILGTERLPAIEIIPHEGFYDYKNKYQKGLATEVCPADLSSEQAARVGEYAYTVHQALRLGSYSRVDFILGTDGVFYCLEANTLPGMTPTSLLPQEAAQIGLSYSDLCDRIVQMAYKKE
ncbi:MAG: D-alanine--D-alanine ligase [Clostridiales bacterium]|nr:D-alanine--D-alanine ligase [Clostridiales bacterium]